MKMTPIHGPLLLAAVLLLAGCPGPSRPAGREMTIHVSVADWPGPHTNGRQLTSENYRIFTTIPDRTLGRSLNGFMEASHANYLALTGLEPLAKPTPMPMYVMASKNEWSALTQTVISQPGQQHLTLQAGGYCYQGVCVLYNMGGLGTLLVAAHEGCHQFLYHRLKDRLPMWLEEGLCSVSEGYQVTSTRVRFTPDQNPVRLTDLRRALVSQRWTPLSQLLPMDSHDALARRPEQAVDYYGQVWALVRFIRSRDEYRKGMERLLADAATGELYKALDLPSRTDLLHLRINAKAYNQTISQPLFKHYICDDLDRFEVEFKRYAREICGI